MDGAASYWHLAFTDKPHRNLADSNAADYKKITEFDRELIRNGIYLIPGGRRLTTAAHSAAEMEITLRAIEASCSRLKE